MSSEYRCRLMPGSKDAPANRWQRNDSTLRAAASDPQGKKSTSHCERIKTHPSWMPLQPRDERDGRDAHDNDMAVSSYIPFSCHAAASSRRFGHLMSLIVLEAQGTCPLCNLARRDERRAQAHAVLESNHYF